MPPSVASESWRPNSSGTFLSLTSHSRTSNVALASSFRHRKTSSANSKNTTGPRRLTNPRSLHHHSSRLTIKSLYTAVDIRHYAKGGTRLGCTHFTWRIPRFSPTFTSRRGCSGPARVSDSGRIDASAHGPCRNCGGAFHPGHVFNFSARGVTCHACGKRDHFARVCRSNQQPRTADTPPPCSSSSTAGTSHPDRRNRTASQPPPRQPMRYIGQSPEISPKPNSTSSPKSSSNDAPGCQLDAWSGSGAVPNYTSLTVPFTFTIRQVAPSRTHMSCSYSP